MKYLIHIFGFHSWYKIKQYKRKTLSKEQCIICKEIRYKDTEKDSDISY